ncbi:MAG: hypothetical protein R2877_04265 [Bdellovibrionota bacterium]
MPFDKEAIAKSLQKTGKLLVVNETPKSPTSVNI